MKYFGDIHIKGDNSIIGLNANPTEENPYSGWVTYDIVDESIELGQALCLDFENNRWKLASCDNFNTMPAMGIALTQGVRGRKIPILRYGLAYLDRFVFRGPCIYVGLNGQIQTDPPQEIGQIIQCIGTRKTERIGIFDFNIATIQVG